MRATTPRSCETSTMPMPVLALDITQQVEHLRLYGHIQRRSGFVGEEDVRVEGQRDGKHAPLAHPSGKIVRLQEPSAGLDCRCLRGGQQSPRRSFCASSRLILRCLQHGFRDLLPDGDRGVQRGHGVLKQHGKQRNRAACASRFSVYGAGCPCRRLSILPLIRALPGRSFMTDLHKTDLPHPDSPTMASVSPRLEGQRNVPDGL